LSRVGPGPCRAELEQSQVELSCPRIGAIILGLFASLVSFHAKSHEILTRTFFSRIDGKQ